MRERTRNRYFQGPFQRGEAGCRPSRKRARRIRLGGGFLTPRAFSRNSADQAVVEALKLQVPRGRCHLEVLAMRVIGRAGGQRAVALELCFLQSRNNPDSIALDELADSEKEPVKVGSG